MGRCSRLLVWKSRRVIETVGVDSNENDMCKEEDDIKNKSLVIRKGIKYLLNNKVDFEELNYFIEFYIEKLIQRELAATTNLIYQDELLYNFKSFWGETLLDSINYNFDIDKRHNWVSTITRKHSTGFQPMQHILFVEFLVISIEEIFISRETFEAEQKIISLKMKMN